MKWVMDTGQDLFPSVDHFFPFSVQRFSCIIGPNGSGKSNIIDSLLFVFGYRAQKIRSKKLSVLIHNSDEHENIQSCSVEVHFQKITDKVCMIPGFFPEGAEKLLIFAYFRWSWGKLQSKISLPLGYKPSVLINFKNPLLSSAALKILVRILSFAAGLICDKFLFESNLEIFNHHFKKN